MKKAAILFILLQFVFVAMSEARCFYFHGTDNTEYVNPANWSPSYPGTKITKDDTVMIQSDVHFAGFNLVIDGKFEIVMGASCLGKNDGIIIKANGKLMNEGELRIKFVDNQGVIDNSVAAVWISDSCMNHQYGLVNCLLASETAIKHKMTNEGKWNIGGKCVIEGELTNEGEIALAHSANIQVKGNYLASANSKVLKSIQSVFLTEKQVANSTSNTNYSQLLGMKAM